MQVHRTMCCWAGLKVTIISIHQVRRLHFLLCTGLSTEDQALICETTLFASFSVQIPRRENLGQKQLLCFLANVIPANQSTVITWNARTQGSVHIDFYVGHLTVSFEGKVYTCFLYLFPSLSPKEMSICQVTWTLRSGGKENDYFFLNNSMCLLISTLKGGTVIFYLALFTVVNVLW